MKTALIALITIPLFTVTAFPVTPDNLDKIGQRIFLNECGGKREALVSWNDGEEFMSLGIGHFIWYPEGYEGPFNESFPDLIKYMKKSGAVLPAWLENSVDPHCPWPSRGEFLRDSGGPRAKELRELLSGTVPLQAAFIVNRMELSLPKILDAAPQDSRDRIKRNFDELSSTPAGIYALVDYINFKGEGVLPTERYNGQGWGLLWVLGRMDGDKEGKDAVREFVRAAKEVLAERVKNAPSHRGEGRWLKGWENRLDTYLEYG